MPTLQVGFPFKSLALTLACVPWSLTRKAQEFANSSYWQHKALEIVALCWRIQPLYIVYEAAQWVWWQTYHNWGEPERAPHRRECRARSVCMYVWYDRHPRAPFHTFSTKAACNVLGWKVCVVKTTAVLCSNIAHIGLFAIFPSWSGI